MIWRIANREFGGLRPAHRDSSFAAAGSEDNSAGKQKRVPRTTRNNDAPTTPAVISSHRPLSAAAPPGVRGSGRGRHVDSSRRPAIRARLERAPFMYPPGAPLLRAM